MKKQFGVDWKKYPSYYDLITNSDTVTLVISVKSQYSDSVLNSLINYLEEQGYTSTSKLKDGTVLCTTIFEDEKMVGILESHYVWIVAELSDHFCKHVLEILKTDFSYSGKVVGQIPHLDESVLDGPFVMRCRSGKPPHSTRLSPYSIFQMLEYENDSDLLAQALVEFYNSETQEFEPSIRMIEMSYKNQNYGMMFLKFIEDRLRLNGFTNIWALDIQNSFFWKEAGYRIIDNDHAIKHLRS